MKQLVAVRPASSIIDALLPPGVNKSQAVAHQSETAAPSLANNTLLPDTGVAIGPVLALFVNPNMVSLFFLDVTLSKPFFVIGRRYVLFVFLKPPYFRFVG